MFLYYNTEDVIRSLDEFVTNLAPITRQSLLQNLDEPLTEQEQKLVGRWEESSDAEHDESLEIIYRKNRTYLYLAVSQPAPSLYDGNETPEEFRHTGHGIWQIIDDQMQAVDLVWGDDKSPTNAPIYTQKVISLSNTEFNIVLHMDNETINLTGEAIGSFEGLEMADYNKEEALSEFDVFEAINKANDIEGEIDFGPNHQLDQPLNLVAKISRALLDHVGIGTIKGVGMSSTKPQADLFRHKVFIHHNEAKSSGNLWSILGSEPHEFSMLKLLPADTALAFSHEIHPPGLARLDS